MTSELETGTPRLPGFYWIQRRRHDGGWGEPEVAQWTHAYANEFTVGAWLRAGDDCPIALSVRALSDRLEPPREARWTQIQGHVNSNWDLLTEAERDEIRREYGPGVESRRGWWYLVGKMPAFEEFRWG